MKDRIKVVIIGAGRIGAFYDSPKSSNILTHAHAFSKHSGFELLGFIDKDYARAKTAAKIWGVKAFKDIEESFLLHDINMVCVATTAETHYQVMEELSRRSSLKLILLEKPITKTIKEAKELLGLYDANDAISVAVNYFRGYLPEIVAIKKNISRGFYGKFINGTGFYTRGAHSDSHIIDLIQNLLGEIGSFKAVNSQPGFSKGDPIVSSVLTLRNDKKFYLSGLDRKLPTMLEIDLFFEKRRIRIYDLGQRIEIYKVLPSKLFKGYKNMVKTSEHKTSFDQYMHYVAENIFQHLAKQKKLKCSLADSYKVFEICDKMVKEANKTKS